MTVRDQFGRTVNIPEPPQRIISLVPSQTEFLADLGLGERVVGITRFCEHPRDWFLHKTRVGGTKDPDFLRIEKLRPDLIIGNAEENTKADIRELEKHYPVWISDIQNLQDALDMMRGLGTVTGKPDRAEIWIDEISSAFGEISSIKTKRKALYLIWRTPWMAAGRSTFINDMLERAGFENALNAPESRYPELAEDEIRELNPDFVLLSSEPYPFSEKHIGEWQELLPKSTIAVVNGAAFSWYGSRLLHTPPYFKQLQIKLKLL